MSRKTGTTLKRTTFPILALLAVLALAACGRDADDGSQKAVATVNGYRMTLDDFHRQLRAEQEFTPEIKLTREVRKRFLEELIRKELMIQEAKKQELDTREDFVRAIERHWESTLIRNLLEIKGRQIEGRIVVSEEEIASRYGKLTAADSGLPPVEKMRTALIRQIREEKKTRQLQEWIDGLWKKSRIEIDEALLADGS